MDLGVTRVVMEATSDYRRPAFYLLEARGFEVWLVNAKDVKHLPGRPKTDVLDALWLCKIAERQMIRPSFVPSLPIRRLRDLTRYRAALVSDRTGEKNRVEKKTAMPLAVSRGHARRRAMSRWHRGQPRPPLEPSSRPPASKEARPTRAEPHGWGLSVSRSEEFQMGAPSRTERALPTSPSTTRRSRLNSPRTLCLWLLRCGARACW